jgi:hypothetical protein
MLVNVLSVPYGTRDAIVGEVGYLRAVLLALLRPRQL